MHYGVRVRQNNEANWAKLEARNTTEIDRGEDRMLLVIARVISRIYLQRAAARSLAILTLWMSEASLALILSRVWFCLTSAVFISLAMFLMLPTMALTWIRFDMKYISVFCFFRSDRTSCSSSVCLSVCNTHRLRYTKHPSKHIKDTVTSQQWHNNNQTSSHTTLQHHSTAVP